MEATLMINLKHELQTQDNRATGHPIYCVFDAEDKFRQPFFTNAEALEYIENECYEGVGYIYIKSGNDNQGWKAARELLGAKGDT